MGQAKFRKAHDPEYGKAKPTVRGLIISPPMVVSGDTVSITSSELDPKDLRASLLYWDRLAVPASTMISFGEEDLDAKYLESAGVLYRPKYPIDGSMSDIMMRLPALALEDYEKTSPGAWSIGGGENSILTLGGYTTAQEGILISLYGAIPIPSEEVPLPEILNFRQKRRDELLSFRAHLDSLAQEISSSKDTQAELKRKLSELDKACSDLAKVCQEWQSPVYLGDLKASLNFSLVKAIASATTAWAALGKIELGLTTKVIASTLATVGSQFEIKKDIKFRSIKRDSSPFKYVYEAQKFLL